MTHLEYFCAIWLGIIAAIFVYFTIGEAFPKLCIPRISYGTFFWCWFFALFFMIMLSLSGKKTKKRGRAHATNTHKPEQHIVVRV